MNSPLLGEGGEGATRVRDFGQLLASFKEYNFKSLYVRQ